jgi:hypothetical protein
MSAEPEVLTGPRGPASERAAQALEASQRRPGPGANFFVDGIPDGKKVYQFVAERYRLQLTAPYDEKLPDGRVKVADKAKKVTAENYLVTLDTVVDKDIIDLIEGIPEPGVEPFRWNTPPHRSLGKDFWDFSNVVETSKRKAIDTAIDTITLNTEALKDPVGRKRVIEALMATGGVEGFGLPKKAEKQEKAEKPKTE